ncbi:peptidoglycan-binding protein [Streptomyces sp. NPDC096080]|uniref:peptidoglycan-binding protein n=1 Tax=Streptomyces sp. NPDC096080 TaxID=3156693 RepID=UPI00332E00C9
MRSNVVARTLVSLSAVAGLAIGGLAAATPGFAAQPPAAVAQSGASVLATQNFGLTSAEAKNVQNWLKTYWSYTDSIDGQLGTNSWKAFQRCLQTYWGYTGAIDGDAGSGTRAAFKRFANGI